MDTRMVIFIESGSSQTEGVRAPPPPFSPLKRSVRCLPVGGSTMYTQAEKLQSPSGPTQLPPLSPPQPPGRLEEGSTMGRLPVMAHTPRGSQKGNGRGGGGGGGGGGGCGGSGGEADAAGASSVG